MRATTWRRILVAGLLATSAGCNSLPEKEKHTAPTKPTLTVKVQADGGMCLDRENSEKLGAYILELERQGR